MTAAHATALVALYGARVYAIALDDDAPETGTLADFADANDGSPDLVAQVARLRIGESITEGGGAAPTVTITRIR